LQEPAESVGPTLGQGPLVTDAINDGLELSKRIQRSDQCRSHLRRDQERDGLQPTVVRTDHQTSLGIGGLRCFIGLFGDSPSFGWVVYIRSDGELLGDDPATRGQLTRIELGGLLYQHLFGLSPLTRGDRDWQGRDSIGDHLGLLGGQVSSSKCGRNERTDLKRLCQPGEGTSRTTAKPVQPTKNRAHIWHSGPLAKISAVNLTHQTQHHRFGLARQADSLAQPSEQLVIAGRPDICLQQFTSRRTSRLQAGRQRMPRQNLLRRPRWQYLR
jgi:hypothetical protein